MKRRNFVNLWYAVVLAMLLTLGLIGGAAANTARVYVQPVGVAEDAITVEVMATGVVDLYGAGTLLDPQNGFVVANKVDEQTGTVLYAITLINPAEPVNGDGVLARVTFKKLGAGKSIIAVEGAKLVAHSLELLPLETAGLEVGNGTSPVAGLEGAMAEVGGPKIWALGLIVLAGMVVSAGAWLLTRQRKSPVSQVVSPQPQQRSKPNRQPVRGSPASLVRQGYTALNEGDISGAYGYFSEAVEIDPYNLDAWMGKAQTARSERERQMCLKRARELSQQ
jgi:hypothetical protein